MFGKITIGAIIGGVGGFAASSMGIDLSFLPSGFSGLEQESEELLVFAGIGGLVGLLFGVIDR